MADGADPVEPDDGLKRLLTYTFIALAGALLLAGIGVLLAVRWLDVPGP